MKPCPICCKKAAQAFQPFCSARCADLDLHRWLGEAYRLPAKADEEDEADIPENSSI